MRLVASLGKLGQSVVALWRCAPFIQDKTPMLHLLFHALQLAGRLHLQRDSEMHFYFPVDRMSYISLHLIALI